MHPARYVSLSASTVASVGEKLIAAMKRVPAREMTVADWKRIRREGLKLAKSRTQHKNKKA